MEQRRFAVMGQNLFLIVSKLMRNQNLCKLLYYTDVTPLAPDKAMVNGIDLLHKNILIVPKPPDQLLTKENFVLVIFRDFYLNSENTEFKVDSVIVDVICPFDEWVISENSLRPYLLMQEIDKELNTQKFAGVGTLTFSNAVQLTISPQLGGYSMEYQCNAFN